MLILLEEIKGVIGNRRRTHNTMTKGRETKRHTIVDKKLYINKCVYFFVNCFNFNIVIFLDARNCHFIAKKYTITFYLLYLNFVCTTYFAGQKGSNLFTTGNGTSSTAWQKWLVSFIVFCYLINRGVDNFRNIAI